MIVGVYFARAAGATQQLAGAVGYHLVRIHIGRGSGTRLKNIQDKVAIKLTVDYFLRSLHNSLGDLWINGAKAFIHLRRSLFDLSKRSNKLSREAQIANWKIEYGTVGTCAPIRVCRNLHLTHRVTLDAGFLCGAHSDSPR